MYETLVVETKGGVRVITLNRPEVLNAVNAQMGQDLLQALREAEREAEVRCVLLAASGRGFCAGADLREQVPGVPLVVATVVNGSRPTYLPPREAYGKGLYQESVAVLAPGSLEQLIQKIGEQLRG